MTGWRLFYLGAGMETFVLQFLLMTLAISAGLVLGLEQHMIILFLILDQVDIVLGARGSRSLNRNKGKILVSWNQLQVGSLYWNCM